MAVIALLAVVGLVAVLYFFGAPLGAPLTNLEQTTAAIVIQNGTALAQLNATQTAISVFELTRTALAQIFVEDMTQTALALTPTPSVTPSRIPTSTRVIPEATDTREATNPPNAASTATLLESGMNDVAQTATALAILFATVVSPTQESVGGAITATATAQVGGDEPTPTQKPETATTTPLSTRAPLPSATATPLVIAAASLLIRSDVSGEIIGDGTLRVYAPETARFPETARVELELHLDNLYITPTPAGERGTPVPRSTTVVSSGGATATPYLPIITDQGVPIYQRMGATLLCSEQSFQGCDTGRDPSQAKIVSSQTTTWSWIVSPNQNISGSQDLQLEVWLVERNLDGKLEYLDLPGTPYHFTIEINPATGSSALLIVSVGVAVLVLIGAAFIVRGRKRSRAKSVRVQPPVGQAAPLVFISYRRGPSWGQARSIEQSLRERGANVFIDIDDINEGRFAETIEKAILDCDYFVVVLAPGTLDSPWVRREIVSALAAKKIIIPLLVDGYRLNAENIPAEIKDIASHNAISVLPEFYQEAMNRLAERFLRLGDKEN